MTFIREHHGQSPTCSEIWNAGAESQRQVGPCGKHPVACWEEHTIETFNPEGTRGRCLWCASEQALRAEIAARDATIAELGADRDHSDSCLCETANKLLEVNRNLATREAELTTLRDKLRKLEAWLGIWTEVDCFHRKFANELLAALLAEEAGR